MTDSKTTAPLTDSQIAALRTRAAADGDDALVNVCWLALGEGLPTATTPDRETARKQLAAVLAAEPAYDCRLANMIERGNGFPRVGDYVADEDGDLWEVIQAGSRITTDHPRGNVCHNYHVVPADWDDCAEGEDHSAAIEWPAD